MSAIPVITDISNAPAPAPAPVPAPVPRKKRVVVALPGSQFSSTFLVSWTTALFHLWQQGYNIVVSPATSSYVTFARMKTMGLDVLRGKNQKPFNGELDYDVYVSLDSDIVFTPAMLVELIESTDIHPVVSGYYMMADNQHFAVVKDWSHAHFAKHGTFEFLKPTDIQTWWGPDANPENMPLDKKFMEVTYAGMGFFACRREVLESLKYPFFDAPLQHIVSAEGRELVDMCSEDVAFSKNIQSAGYKVQLHTGLRVGHEKLVML